MSITRSQSKIIQSPPTQATNAELAELNTIEDFQDAKSDDDHDNDKSNSFEENTTHANDRIQPVEPTLRQLLTDLETKYRQNKILMCSMMTTDIGTKDPKYIDLKDKLADLTLFISSFAAENKLTCMFDPIVVLDKPQTQLQIINQEPTKQRIDADSAIQLLTSKMLPLDSRQPVDFIRNLIVNLNFFNFSNGKISDRQFAMILIQKMEIGQHHFTNMKSSLGPITDSNSFILAVFKDLFKASEMEILLNYVHKPNKCYSLQSLAEEVKTVIAIAPHVLVDLHDNVNDPSGARIFLMMLPDSIKTKLIESFDIRNSICKGSEFYRNFHSYYLLCSNLQSLWDQVTTVDKEKRTNTSTRTTTNTSNSDRPTSSNTAANSLTTARTTRILGRKIQPGPNWCDRHGPEADHNTGDCPWNSDQKKDPNLTCEICGMIGHHRGRCFCRPSWMEFKPATSTLKCDSKFHALAFEEYKEKKRTQNLSENKVINHLKVPLTIISSNILASTFPSVITPSQCAIQSSHSTPVFQSTPVDTSIASLNSTNVSLLIHTTSLDHAISNANSLHPQFTEHTATFVQPMSIPPLLIPIEIQSVTPALEVSAIVDTGSMFSFCDTAIAKSVKDASGQLTLRTSNLQVYTVAGITTTSNSIDIVFQTGWKRAVYSFYILPGLCKATGYEVLIGRDLISHLKLDALAMHPFFPRVMRQDIVSEEVKSFGSHILDEDNQNFERNCVETLEPFHTKVIPSTEDSAEVLAARKLAYDTIIPAFRAAQPPPNSVINHDKAIYRSTLRIGCEEVYIKQHRISDPMRPYMDEKVNKWREVEVMVPFKPSDKHPILRSCCPIIAVIQKRDSTGKPIKVRICYNAVESNKVTDYVSYRAPDLQGTIDHLMDYKYYSQFDGQEYFTQFRIHPDDQHLFGVHPPNSDVPLVFAKMIFGLAGAPSCAQEFSDIASAETPNTVCYIDNFFQAYNTTEECIPLANAFLKTCKKYNIRINVDDIQLCATKMIGLGAVISHGKREVDPKRVQKLVNWPVLKSKESITSFLASFVFISHHIRYFSTIVAPLRELVKKGVKVDWTKAQQDAIDLLKLAVSKLPPLKKYQKGKFNHLHTDSSEAGGGWVFFQTDSSEDNVVTSDNVVMFYSFAFNSGQKAYNITQKELFSIIHALLYLFDFLVGNPVYVSTDHKALTWLMKNATESGTRTSRNWMHILIQFDLRIRWIPGSENTITNDLSRIYSDSEWWGVPTPPALARTAVNLLQIKNMTSDDNAEQTAHFSPTIENDIETAFNNSENWTDEFKYATGLLFIESIAIPSMEELNTDSLLVESSKIGEEDSDAQNLISADPNVEEILPYPGDKNFIGPIADNASLNLTATALNDVGEKFIEGELEMLIQIHKSTHMGPNKMLNILKERDAPFKTTYKKAKIIADSCIPCLQNKRDLTKIREYRKVKNISPNHTWHIDIAYFGSATDSADKNALIISDTMTRMIYAFAQTAKTAVTVVQNLSLLTSIIGFPTIIRSDNEALFHSAEIQEFCQLYDIVHEFTTEYVHNQNRAERPIGIIRPIINSLCQARNISWEQALYLAVSIANSSESTNTKWIPHNLMFGKDSGLFRKINPDSTLRKSPEVAVIEWKNHIANHQNDILPRITELENIRHDSRIADLNKKINRSIDSKVYPIGQIVFVAKDVISDKSDTLYDGPYKIAEVTSDLKYKIQDSNRTTLSREYTRSQLKIPAFYESTIAELDFAGTSVRCLDYIKCHRRKSGHLEYLIKWLGLDDSHNEWVYSSLVEKSAILEYFSAYKGNRLPKTKTSNRILIPPSDSNSLNSVDHNNLLPSLVVPKIIPKRTRRRKHYDSLAPSSRAHLFRPSRRTNSLSSPLSNNRLPIGGSVSFSAQSPII